MQNIFFVIIVSFLCISCSKNDDSYFPLSSGLKWHYSVSLTTRDGLENQKYILLNAGSKEIDGELVYRRESLDGTNLFYKITDEGIYYLGSVANELVDPKLSSFQSLVIPYPLILNKKWQQVTHTEVPMEVEILSFQDIVNVPAGQFDKCMKVVMTGSSYKDAGNYVGLTLVSVEQTNWYAPGVGLVKMERLEKTQSEALDKGTLSVELTHFEVN